MLDDGQDLTVQRVNPIVPKVLFGEMTADRFPDVIAHLQRCERGKTTQPSELDDQRRGDRTLRVAAAGDLRDMTG